MEMNRKTKKCFLFSYLTLFNQLMFHLNNQFFVFIWYWKRLHRRVERIRQCYLLLQYGTSLREKGPNRQRSEDWWENEVKNTYTDKEFYENFRMSKQIFKFVCDELREQLTSRENPISSVKKKISVEKKVALCLYYLASCCEYRVSGNQFGLHKSTVCKILHEFVDAVLEKLTPVYIIMPTIEEAHEIAKHFNEISHIPNILGAIDGTHIPILPPSDGYRDFINRKCWPSLVLQAVVDNKYRFLNISVKNPGSTHDASVLRTSSLYKHHERLIPKSNIELKGHALPFVLIGDPAYPLLPWILKAYTGKVSATEDSFNAYLNSSRVLVENAFGRLKARWRTLLKRSDVHYSFVPKIVATCCTLHNIIEKHGGKFNNEWLQAVEDANELLPQPQAHATTARVDATGHNIRDFLKQYLCCTYPLRKSGFT